MDPAVQAALTGGLVSTAGDLLGASASFGFGQAAAGRQWDKWKDSQTRGPTYRLIGLEEAGLNPILAAKGGLGGGGGGFTPTAVASGGGGLPLGSNATRAAKEIGLLRDQAKNLRAQRGNQDSAASLNRAMEKIRKVEVNTAKANLIAREATAAAEVSESAARQARAGAERQLWQTYSDRPTLYLMRHLFGSPISAAKEVLGVGQSMRPDVDTIFEDRWSEDHRTGDTKTSGSKRQRTRGKKPLLRRR